MQQPPQNPEQPSYPYQQQTGPDMPPPPQYQQPYTQYQQPFQQPPKKERGPLFWILIGLAAGFVLSIAICGIPLAIIGRAVTTPVNNPSATLTANTSSSTSSTTSSIYATATAIASTPASTPPPSNQVSKVGGTITLNGVQATLVSVKTSPGGQYDTPKSGNEYVIVHIKLNNTSNKEQSYNEFDFHVKSGSGNITQQDYLSTENNSDLLNYGTLSAGGSAEGDLVFQVKIGDHKAELTWQPSYFGNAGDNGWNLGL